MQKTRLRRAAILTGAALIALAAAVAAWWVHVPSRYFPASEVDHVAAPLRAVDLSFPENGPEIFGKLPLNLFIYHRGVVDRAEVLESTVPPSFRNYAVGVFTATRFDPAQRGGRAVKSVKKIEIVFAPSREDKLWPAP